MWPYVILSLVTLQRLSELIIARRNTAVLMAQGATEVGAGHYPIIVAFHALWLIGLWFYAGGQPINWVFIGAFAILQAIRIWVLTTLGPRWTTRIIVTADKPLVMGGPFKYLRHPNYAVVGLEIILLPLAFGMIGYAGIFGLINVFILAYRIYVEENALSPQR
jgi:methyltransferase